MTSPTKNEDRSLRVRYWLIACLAIFFSAIFAVRLVLQTLSKPVASLSIVSTEYRFAPGVSKVRPGPVRFVWRNQGQISHAFEIEGVTPNIWLEPGEEVTSTFRLARGRFFLVCNISGHDMKAEIRVGP